MDSNIELASPKVNITRFWRKIILNLSTSVWCPSSLRYKIVRMGGVNIEGPCFIGAHVTFDTIRPDLISIGKGSVITVGTCIFSHHLKNEEMIYGEVKIGRGSFIGAYSIIAQPVTVGDRAVIGAGSIVIRDIPSMEVWAGNPAHFIRKKQISHQ